MAKKSGSRIPEGFQKRNTAMRYVAFENEGDMFHGVFLKRQQVKSDYSKDAYAWMVKALDGNDGLTAGKEHGEVIQGETYFLAEKTSMEMLATDISQGEEFYLEFAGEKPSTKRKGKNFKEFNLYLMSESD